ncbi:unnamed protein product, partial [Callosobruchus maculatus]
YIPGYSGHRLANVAHFSLVPSPSKDPIELPSECLTQNVDLDNSTPT